MVLVILAGAVLVLGGAGAAFFLAKGRQENAARSEQYDAKVAEEKRQKEDAEKKEASDRAKKRSDLEARVRTKMSVVEKIAGGTLPAPSARRKVKVVDPKPIFYSTTAEPTTNAASEPSEHLALAHPSAADPIYHSGDLHACAAFAKGKNAEITDLALKTCDELRYLAVLRTKRVEARVVAGGKFIAGSCDGDAIVFDLSTGAEVASVPIRGTNSDEVTQHLQDVSPERYLKQDLDRGCAWAAQSEINDAYAKK